MVQRDDVQLPEGLEQGYKLMMAVFISHIMYEFGFNIFLIIFNIILKEWSLRLSCACSASGRSTPEGESDLSQETEDPSCISAREQEISVLGIIDI